MSRWLTGDEWEMKSVKHWAHINTLSVQSNEFNRNSGALAVSRLQVPLQHIYSILLWCLVAVVGPVCLFVHHSQSKVSIEILSTAHLIVATWLRVCCLLKDFRQFSTLFIFRLHLRLQSAPFFLCVLCVCAHAARLTRPNEIQRTSNTCKFIQDEKYTKELIRDPPYTCSTLLVMVVVVYSTANEKRRNELGIHILFIPNSEHDNKYFMIYFASCMCSSRCSLSGFRMAFFSWFSRMCMRINFRWVSWSVSRVSVAIWYSSKCVYRIYAFPSSSATTFSLCRVVSGSELDLCSNKIQILLYFYWRLVEWHPLTRNRINMYL